MNGMNRGTVEFGGIESHRLTDRQQAQQAFMMMAHASSSMTSSTSSAQQQQQQRRRRRLGFRLLLCLTLAGIALIGVLLAGTYWMTTRSWFLISQIQPQLERKLGGKVAIAQAEYQGDGKVLLTGIALRAWGVAGPAGQIASIARANVAIDLQQLLAGRVQVSDLALDDVIVRISESTSESGRFNFMALTPQWIDDDDEKDPLLPPHVRIHDATFEFGTHSGGSYEAHGSIRLAGELYPAEGGEGWYNFELRELDKDGRAASDAGLFVKGEWNVATNEHRSRLEGLDFNHRIYAMCPQAVRVWWDRMQFQGQIDAMTAEWAPDQPLEVDFFVRNVSITLPFEPEGFWSRYQDGQVLETESRPRMDVRSGTIRLRNDSLILDELVGNFGSTESSEYVLPVPFTLSFALTSLPEIDWQNREAWMEKVLASSPFDMHLQLNEFVFRRSESGQSLAIDLPRVIAGTLARFELTNWVLSASITVSRGAPAIGEDGESIAARPHTSGQVYVRHASGRYQKFPFPVENVDAYLQFDNEKVVIHHLTGTGINGAKLRMSGEVRPPGNDAAVSLRLKANDVPIDDELRHALSGSEAIAFDAIFNAAFRDSLAAAEVLPDDRWLQRQMQELLDVQEQIALLRASLPSESNDGDHSQRIAALSSRAERLRRSIETGPFVLGGMVDLDLRIERAAGRHQPTITTGAVSIQSAGLLYDHFPYPLRITGGKIDWQPNRIVIVPGSAGEGLSFVTPGGGRGSINGEVSFVRHDGQHMTIPNLQIAVADDEITDLIYTSIPLSQRERKRIEESASLWPGGVLSDAAKMVQAIGLRGSISYAGTIVRHAEDEPTDWQFELTLDDVHAEPHASLGNALGINGQVLPDNFLLRNVTGKVNINRDGVSWSNVSGVSEAVLASAHHDDDGDDAEKGEPDAASAAAVVADADATADILTQIASTGHLDFRPGKPDSVSVTFTDFPLQPYLLHFVPPELLQRAQQLWGRYLPRGTIDAEMRYVRNDEAASSTTFTVRPGNCAIEIDQRHVNMRGVSGGILFGAGSDIQVQHLVLELSRDHGRQAGTLSLDGSIQLQEKRRGLALSGQWIGGQLDSPLIPEGLRLMGAGGQAERFIAHQPAGVFDARFDVQIQGDAAPDYTIRLQPRAVALQVNHTPLYADIDSGLITFTPGSIRIDDVQGTHADGEFSASGTIDTAELIDVQLLVDYDGRLRSDFVEALLPRSVMQVFDSLAFADGGNTRVSDLHLRLHQARKSDGHKAWVTDAQGRMTTRNASFVAGTRFEAVDGEFDLQVRYTPGEPLHLQVDASASRATVMGVTMHDVHAPIALSADGTVLQMPELRGAIGEGMVTASAWAGMQPDGEYEIVLNMVGVPLEAVVPAQDNEASSSATPVSRGDIYGRLHLAGHRDKPDSRRGRGLVRVLNGRVATVPLVLRMVQMLQFTLPMGGKINYAEADLYIVGNRVGFERILFESAVAQSVALQLIGEGEMTFDTLELDTQFRVRGGVPILRDIIGSLGDHLYGIEVTGPLRDPHVRLVPLPSGN